MTNNSFSTTLVVDQSPAQVFQAVQNVRDWWSGLYGESFSGGTERLNDEFTFRAGEGAHFSKQRLVEVIPNQKVVWLVTDANLSFVDKTDEWVGTTIRFDISQKGDKTELRFTHEGLTPALECYNSCSPAWKQYVEEKLLPLIKKA